MVPHASSLLFLGPSHRYDDVLPFDDNRVTVQGRPDYINAVGVWMKRHGSNGVQSLILIPPFNCRAGSATCCRAVPPSSLRKGPHPRPAALSGNAWLSTT